MEGLFGHISESSLIKFMLFIVLVWLAASLGIVLAGLLPVPNQVKVLMAPSVAANERDRWPVDMAM